MANRIKKTAFKPKVTIVIGTLNRPKQVQLLIEQLKNYQKHVPIEVILVDQSSPENYLLVQKSFSSLHNFKLVRLDLPNTCRYLNYGWKNAQAPIVLYLDDDVEITKETIDAHLSAYENPSINGVAGRVINDDEKTTGEIYIGKIRWFGAIIHQNFSSQNMLMVDFPYGCNMSFKKQVLEEMGGFDERLAGPIYSYNEVDFGFRITKKWPNSIIFLPQALVYHHKKSKGGTRNDFDNKIVFECNNFNYGYFLGKNFNLFENIICFLRMLPYQMFYNYKALPSIVKGFLFAKNK